MRRLLRILIAIAKWAALIAVTAIAIVVVINLFDESPTPAALALAEPPPAPPTADNAYFALVGFNAPVGVDPAETGKRRVAEHDAKARTNPWAMPEPGVPSMTAPSDEEATRHGFVGDRRIACGTFDAVSLGEAPAKVGALRALHAANSTLVERYFALRGLPEFTVTAIPSIMQPGPEYSDWSAVQQVLLCEAFVDAQLGNPSQGLKFIGDDLRFLRRMLAGQGTLISEMIATAFIARELRVLSKLIATPTFPAEAHATSLRTMLAPLQSPGAGMAHAFASEYAMQAALFRQLPTTPEPPPPDDETFEAKVERLVWSKHLAGLFYKPQATANLSAKGFEQLIGLANAAPAEFVARRDRLRSDFAEPGAIRVDMVYNPIGKLLVEVAQPHYDDYIARVFDLAAYANLVRAQLEIRLAAVPSDRVEAFLSNAAAETKNPYDGKPFTWDVATRTLSFQPQTQRWRDWGTSVSVALPPSAN
jgi:hypothetical protein